MACSHDTIPEGVSISMTRVTRCRENHLHRMHYYFCYLCGTDLFMHAEHTKYLAYGNLRPEVKEALGEEVRAATEKQIEEELPIDATILYSEMPPGFEYGYVLKMEARCNWNNSKGNYRASEKAATRGEISY